MADDGNDILAKGSRVGVMRLMFSSLVAVSLLIHALLGCCCHHAHDAAACDDSQHGLAAEAGCSHTHNNAPEGDRSHGPCKDRSHCQGLCNYLPAQKTQVGKLQSLVPIDVVAIGPVIYDSQIADLFCVGRIPELAPEPPVRLHLFYQILLI